MRSLCPVAISVIVSLLCVSVAWAQETATSFDELVRNGKLNVGQTLRIVYTPEGETQPREIEIDLVELGKSFVAVGSLESSVSIPADRVESIVNIQSDGLGNGPLIGAAILGGIGAAFLGVPVCVSDGGSCPEALWYAVIQPAAVGALIGLAIDALNRGKTETVAFQRVPGLGGALAFRF